MIELTISDPDEAAYYDPDCGCLVCIQIMIDNLPEDEDDDH